VLGLSQTPPFDPSVSAELATYLTSTGAWTGSATQLRNKVAGLVHLVIGSAEYQLA
jgi:hypothetical protein